MPLDDFQTRMADFRPQSLDRDKRTVRVTVSTGADVQRRGYIEKLTLPDAQSIVGLPVLNTHRQDNLDNLVGRVVASGLDDAGLWADVQISQRAEWLLDEIEAGIITSASIGYRAKTILKSTTANGQAVRTITPEISEISFVPIPADKGATVRTNPMPQIETDDRTDLIQRVAAAHNLDEDWQTRMADAADEISDDEIRADGRATGLANRQAKPSAQIRTQGVSGDDPAVVMQHRSDALYSRASGEAPSDEARPYMNERLSDMARASVEASGTNTRTMSDEQIFRAAMHTVSDFPMLLNNTGNRVLMAAYENAGSPVASQLSRKTTMPDFRPGTKIRVSDGGLLQKVAESGEIQSTTRSETGESYAVESYAAGFSLSYQAYRNDDLGALSDWSRTAGRMASETKNNLLVSKLLDNPKMGEDNKALFHTDHGNLAASGTSLGSSTDLAALEAARLAMRNVKAPGSDTPINATGKFLLVGPSSETPAEKLLSQIYAATYEDANPFSGRLTLLVEPRITDDRWYVFASPANLPVLEYAYLSGAEGPQMSSREGWDVLGMEFRVVLHIGCGAIDFRGAYMNPGE